MASIFVVTRDQQVLQQYEQLVVHSFHYLPHICLQTLDVQKVFEQMLKFI
jgi:hypothetical protein